MLGASETLGSTVLVDSTVAYERAKVAGRNSGRDAANNREVVRSEAMVSRWSIPMAMGARNANCSVTKRERTEVEVGLGIASLDGDEMKSRRPDSGNTLTSGLRVGNWLSQRVSANQKAANSAGLSASGGHGFLDVFTAVISAFYYGGMR